ncbi:hypothetical protein PINS_up011062 [Pythium insidiosum]|nr:hypothetical protein PINS_up011062 [Pythium insidiosum]
MEMLDQLLHPDATARPDAAEVVRWSQELYEWALATQQQHLPPQPSMLRSPVFTSRSFNGTLPPVNLLDPSTATSSSASSASPTPANPTGIFSLLVEACSESTADDSSGSGVRLPNHNLLKEVCDAIAHVHDGKIEIKKCGLQFQETGAQILEFVLDPHLPPPSDCSPACVAEQAQKLRSLVVEAIEALPGVHAVRMDNSMTS